SEAPAAADPATPSTAGGTSADVPNVPVYLQVGAFDRQESAAAFVEQLRAQGFDATVNAPPGRKVRVLVGPFGGDALLDREARLRALGVDSFRVR
ncbi:SPOR domain-containing protein, partial [Deinococcus pimensis]|uniref:SPOR domain-containing protein n=1 Tax=Deinococcus pimensis TaxID=309888 RepID=UPI0004877F97